MAEPVGARAAVTVLLLAVDDPDAVRACLSKLRPTLQPRDRIVVLVPHGGGVPARLSGVRLLLAAADEDARALSDRAAREATTPLVADLHADVVVTPHWVDRLAAALELPGVTAAGPSANAAPPGQAAPTASYDDGRTSLRDYARLRGAALSAPTAAGRPLGEFCRLRRREDSQHPASPAGSVVVTSVFVHHRLLPGCPDTCSPGVDGTAPLISVSLIVKNEQESLAQCLQSVQHLADEVVVYDTGSTDDTLAIATAAGATVVEGYWDDDFGAARNRCLQLCRGTWVLVLDADEVVHGDAADVRRMLQGSAEMAYAVAIRNLASGGTGSSETHLATRLFRRRDAVYTGRLHEQVAHARLGHFVHGPVCATLTLDHSGYTPERIASKAKQARNLALAEADVRAAPTADALTLARANLARAVYVAGDLPRARDLFAQAWDGRPCDSSRLLSLAAVGCAIDGGDHPAAEVWLERLALSGECRPRVEAIRARLLAAQGDVQAALSVLEQLPAQYEQRGLTFDSTSVAALHAALLAGQGRKQEASDVALAAVRQGVSDWHLSQHLAALRSAERPVHDLAVALPPSLRLPFLAQCLQVSPDDGDALLEALWQIDQQPDVLAAASRLATALPVARALEWSARLRSRNLDLCPLLHIAADEARDVRDRAVAAAVAYTTFTDERAVPLLEHALLAVAQRNEAGLLAEIELLAPGLVARV